jgi:pilus assembly protein Flp/PilA
VQAEIENEHASELTVRLRFFAMITKSTQSETPEMTKLIRKFFNDESGATAIEYGLIAALVSVAAIVALTALGTELRDIFNTVSTTLSDAQPTP